MIKKLLYYGKKLLSFSFNGHASRKEYASVFFCDFVTLIGSWIIKILLKSVFSCVMRYFFASCRTADSSSP